jgi:hypothetical protein
MSTRRKIKKTRRTKRKLNKKTTTSKFKNKKLFRGGDFTIAEEVMLAKERVRQGELIELGKLATLLMSPGPDGMKKKIYLEKLTNADAATIIQNLIVKISGKEGKETALGKLVELKTNLAYLPPLEKNGPNKLYSTKDKEKLEEVLNECEDIIKQLPVQTPNTPPT